MNTLFNWVDSMHNAYVASHFFLFKKWLIAIVTGTEDGTTTIIIAIEETAREVG